jgi:hypothetical protein
MGEHVIGDLSTGVKTIRVSRKRALQLMGGALAVAAPAAASQVPQAAEAGKQRKPPEAFAVATLSDPIAADETTFGFSFQLSVVHPATKTTGETTGSVFADANASADQLRKQLADSLKGTAALVLSQSGVSVSRDRIAVTLL